MQYERKDVYAEITNKIVAMIEKGSLPWRQPWDGTGLAQLNRPLRFNGQPYQGVNVLVLWATAMDKGYNSPVWVTFNQAKGLTATVKKGEHGHPVVYADRFKKTEQDGSGNDVERVIPFLKRYVVFNCDQIDGLPAHYYTKPQAPVNNQNERREDVDHFLQSTGADFHESTRAAYNIMLDRIYMPPFQTFESGDAYYATAFHELTHWTRHETRLDRDLGRKGYGDAGYAREELVAELGSSYLCADLSVCNKSHEPSAAYIESWLKALNDNKKEIFTMASHAERSVNYIHSKQPKALTNG